MGIIIYFPNDVSYVTAFLINQNVHFSFKAFTSIWHTVTLISSCLLYTVLSCVFTSDHLYYKKLFDVAITYMLYHWWRCASTKC